MSMARIFIVMAVLAPALVLANAQAQTTDSAKKVLLGKDRKVWKKEQDQLWRHEQNRQGRKWNKNLMYPYKALNIPLDHLPPPGECRVWHPDIPAGQQPAPQPCDMANIPVGVWLIARDSVRYKVSRYNKHHPNVVDEVRYYELR
jgi:hypothetical protein